MLQLSPNESFPIVRVLKDTTDSSTNYVQVVIRDATTDVLVATVNLDDKGNRRFQKVYKVPYGDAYSRGRYLVFTSTVYTDSGYTTINANYAQEADTYLVQERWNPTSWQGGGSIDEVQFRKIVREVFNEQTTAEQKNEEEAIEPIVVTKPYQEIDIEALAMRIQGMVDAIKFPDLKEETPVDLSGLEEGINALLLEIAAMPRFKDTDLSSVVTAITDLKESVEGVREDFKTISADQMKTMAEYYEKLVGDIVDPVSQENMRLKMVEAIRNGTTVIEKESPEQKNKREYLNRLKARFAQ